MKTLKTTLAILLAAILTFTAAFAASADDSVVLNGTAGEGVVWTLTSDGVLTVSGSGAVEDVYESVDEDESTKIGSIGISIAEYLDALCDGMSAADAARTRIDSVKKIVVEEGITAIPDEEFGELTPRTVELPSTLKTLGFAAINAKFAESVVLRSEPEHAQILVPIYSESASPYGSIDEAIDAFVEQQAALAEAERGLAPSRLLQSVFMLQNGLWEPDEQEMADTLAWSCERFETEADTLEELVPAALSELNARFGTSYASVDEIFSIDGDEAVVDGELEAIMNEPFERADITDRLDTLPTGQRPPVGYAAYQWLTVTAPGKAVKAECEETGIPFKSTPGGSAEASVCKYCGKDHSEGFWQKIVGFFHKIFYFFAHLFGRM